MKKFLMFMSIFMLIMTSVFANGNTENQLDDAGVKKHKVALSMALRDQFLTSLETACKEGAKEADITFVSQDAQGNANTQISQIQQFAAQHYDAIIVNLVSTDISQSIIDAAGDVPLVFVNRGPSAELTKGKQTYVGSDERKSGNLQAVALTKYFKEKGKKNINYVLLQGTLGLQHTTLRTEYSKKGLEDAGFTLKQVYQDTAEFDRAKAQNKMQQFIATKQPFDCVIANNDEMALGAIVAMKQAGLDLAQIPVVGIDATPAGLTSMDSNELYATVFQDAKGQGKGAIQAAIDLINGTEISTYVDIPFQLVDKDNYKKFM